MIKPSQRPMPPGASVPDFRWDPNKPEESVEGLHTQAVSFAKQKIDWYYNEAEKNGTHSKRIRFLVVCLLTIGALCPLIEATGLGVGVRLAAWGYVLFALAAGFFALDRFYGLSTSWRRNTSTWLTIRSALIDFEHDWILGGTNPDDRVKLLKQFWRKTLTTVAEETDVWVTEEERAIKALQDNLDRTSAPGSSHT